MFGWFKKKEYKKERATHYGDVPDVIQSKILHSLINTPEKWDVRQQTGRHKHSFGIFHLTERICVNVNRDGSVYYTDHNNSNLYWCYSLNDKIKEVANDMVNEFKFNKQKQECDEKSERISHILKSI